MSLLVVLTLVDLFSNRTYVGAQTSLFFVGGSYALQWTSQTPADMATYEQQTPKQTTPGLAGCQSSAGE